MQPIIFLGKPAASGLYILRIRVEVPLAVAFGRFRQGMVVTLSAGDYLYVGSALGASALPHRLLRHATRSGEYPPHHLRADLFEALQRARLLPRDARPPCRKRLRWHVDYLLDELAVHLIGVMLLPATAYRESALAREFVADPVIVAPAPGLGASDDPGATHLLHVTLNREAALTAWWGRLAARLAANAATAIDELS
jgi:Uri superfamily endonuclease